jgi:hypothetical protein
VAGSASNTVSHATATATSKSTVTVAPNAGGKLRAGGSGAALAVLVGWLLV